MSTNPTAKIYFTSLDFRKFSSPDFDFAQLISNAPDFRQEKIRQYVRLEDKLRCFYSWMMLEGIILREFSLDIRKEIISFNSYGKPYIKNKNNLHFNLSHAGEIVACAIDAFPIGVDVEVISPIDLSIAKSFFSEEECSDLFRLAQEEQLRYFYKLWTLKESYIKAEGKGLSIPLNKFTFKIDDDSINFKGTSSYNWDFSLCDISTDSHQDYYLGFCTCKGRSPDKIEEIGW